MEDDDGNVKHKLAIQSTYGPKQGAAWQEVFEALKEVFNLNMQQCPKVALLGATPGGFQRKTIISLPKNQ